MLLNMVQCGILSQASFFHIWTTFQRHIIACSSAETVNGATVDQDTATSAILDQETAVSSASVDRDTESIATPDQKSACSSTSRLSAVELTSEQTVCLSDDEPPALLVIPGKKPHRSRPTTTSRGCGGQGRPAGVPLLVFGSTGGGSQLLLSPKRGGGGGSGAPAVRCRSAAGGNNNVMRGLWGPPDDKEFANFIRHGHNRVIS